MSNPYQKLSDAIDEVVGLEEAACDKRDGVLSAMGGDTSNLDEFLSWFEPDDEDE